MTLPENVVVYPAHGAGSACGKNMSNETMSTIGDQKVSNYALRADMTEAEFVKEVTDGLLPSCLFPDERGHEPRFIIPALMRCAWGMQEWGVLHLKQLQKRPVSSFWIPATRPFYWKGIHSGSVGEHRPERRSAPWVGALGRCETTHPAGDEEGKVEETVTRLSRVDLTT